MGEISEMMLDGTLCSGCGDFIGVCEGVPARCAACRDRPKRGLPQHLAKAKVPCPQCKRRVKRVGLNDHIRDAHGEIAK